MDEFLEGYYGKSAAPHLRRFVCFLDAASRKEGQFVNLKHDGMEFLTQVELLKLAAIMDEAVAAAEKDGAAFAERVRICSWGRRKCLQPRGRAGARPSRRGKWTACS